MGFPILRLPVVALKVLVDHLNDFELVTVSLLSRRADWFLKICGKKNVSFFNFHWSEIMRLSGFRILQLFLLESKRKGELPDWNFELGCLLGEFFSDQLLQFSCNNFHVRIYSDNLEDIKMVQGIRRNLKIGEMLVPVLDVSYGIHTFWENKTDGLIQLLDYFKTNFNSLIEHLKLPGRDIKAMERVVNYIKSTQTIVKNVLVERCAWLPEYNSEFILKNVSATDSFSSYLSVSRNFKFDGTFRAKTIKIEYGHWFTMQSLLRSNESEVIHVNGSNYTKGELRTFLKEWKAGKLPKLKAVVLATRVSAWGITEGFEKWEGRCRECENRPRNVITIKGHGDCHGGVHTSDRDGFHFSIHEN